MYKYCAISFKWKNKKQKLNTFFLISTNTMEYSFTFDSSFCDNDDGQYVVFPAFQCTSHPKT